jgi:hypothetical protein
MGKRKDFVLTGIGISIISGVVGICVVAAGTLNLNIFWIGILVNIPSILIVGTMIGIWAHDMGADKQLVVLGAAFGWVLGSLISRFAFAVLGLPFDQVPTLILFVLAQVILGSLIGLIPATIAWRLHRST